MSSQFYIHLSWTTLERRPIIGPSEAAFLRRFIPAEAQRHRCDVIAVGVVSDHVHVLIRSPNRLDLPRLLQGLKGTSARLASMDGTISQTGLRWAKGHDARTVSPERLGAVADYVKQQGARHPRRAVV